MLVFGTQSNLEMLETSQYWLVDGTFKSAPELFRQVYVIHALRGGPDPLHNGHLYQTCSSCYPTNSWPTLGCDNKLKHCVYRSPQPDDHGFRNGCMQQLRANLACHICKVLLFHLTQNVWRKVQSEGLQSDYNQDAELVICIRLLPALAFAAPHEVPHLFSDVVRQHPMSQATGVIF